MKTLAKAKILVTRFPYQSQLGGEELHTLALMQALDKRGVEAFFLGSCPVLLKEFKKRGFLTQRAWFFQPPVTKLRLLIFTLLSPLLFLLAGIYLGKARKKWGVTVLYSLSLGEKLLMTPWAHLFGMKVLWLEHARIGKWLLQNPWRPVYRFLSRWVTVVTTSKAMAKILAPWVKHVVSTPCGTLVEKSTALPEDVATFLKSGFSVAIVARLTVDKGVDKMVRLVHSKPDMRLLIVGKGPLSRLLPELHQHPQILWRESLPRPQLMALYEGVDLFLLPSMEMDPFGMVAAEAMWLGTPTLVTDLCGIGTDLEAAHIPGVVSARFTEVDKKIKHLMKHRSELGQMAERQKSFVRAHYALNEMVGAFERLLTI